MGITCVKNGDAEQAMRERAEFYEKLIYAEAPRVLGLMDREELSPTQGCMDRTYWAWKFTDFPGARFQEGLCILAFLWGNKCGEDAYYEHPRLLQWLEGGFGFWAGIQRRSGDFDEAYPFERSLAATAFSLFYLCEAWRYVDTAIGDAVATQFREAVARAGNWLVHNDERHGFLSNHLAAAAGALLHAYQICGDESFKRRYQYFLGRILDHQSDEGWFEEYGGADPGYQTHGCFYLVRCLELAPNKVLQEALERSFAFLSHFVHPDGSLGGEYASRNTQTYYPAAVEMASAFSGRARWIAGEMGASVRHASAVGLQGIDVYNYFPLLNNYVFALRACGEKEAAGAVAAEEPDDKEGVWEFPGAGIVKVRGSAWEVYVGTKKGGVVKAFSRVSQHRVLDDCGYLGKENGGGWVSSQWFCDEWNVSVVAGRIVVEGSLFRIGKPIMRPWRFLAFRLFSLTIGRFQTVSYWLKRVLVRTLIYRSKQVDIAFRREIQLDDDEIVIRDTLRGRGARRLSCLKRIDTFTTIHMGSSRYFVPHQLKTVGKDQAGHASVAVDLREIEKGIVMERRVRAE